MTRSKLFAVAAVAIFSLIAVSESKAQWGYNPYFNPNPVIGGSGRYVTGSYFNPYTGTYVVNSNRDLYRASVTDPYRNAVVPGTQTYVDRWEYDSYGRPVHVTGYQWISANGQPHGQLTRTVQRFGGFTPGGAVVNNNSSTTHYYKAN